MNLVKLMSKRIPVYLVLAIVVLVIAGSISAYAAISSATTRTVTTIGGEIFVLTEELTATPQGVGITIDTISAAGATLATNVTMTTAGASANTALTQGNFEYRLEAKIATTSASQEYSVELFADGTTKGTVYIGQDPSSPAVDDYVTVKWDLGTSLDDSVYEIQVLPE